MHNGVRFVLVPHEHAITIVGYDNKTLIANDPWNRHPGSILLVAVQSVVGIFRQHGARRRTVSDGAPVQQVSVSALTSAALTWTWAKPTGAAHYAVTVTRFGAKSKVEFNGTQDATSYTVNNPSPGKRM